MAKNILHTKLKLGTRAGFTLIEVLVVISILGLLASVMLISLNNARSKARDSKRIATLHQIAKGLELYYNKHQEYPHLSMSLGGCWPGDPYPCEARMDINWNAMLDALRGDKILAEVGLEPAEPASTSWFAKIARAQGSTSGKLQDPQYPQKRFGYMVAAIPLYQSFRIRAELEDPQNQVLKNSVRGKFMFSDDDDTGDLLQQQVSCSPQLGLYCVGPGEYEAFDPGKPVVYLYPTTEQDVRVTIHPKQVMESLPPYDGGWLVRAKPDGTLYNYADGASYPYLFWEGKSSEPYIDKTQGFVIKSEEVEKFLEDSLKQQGLIEREYKEFIEYWAPLMKGKPYIYVYFMPQQDYDRLIPMDIDPKPDTIIRVYMMFRKLNEPVEVTPQQLSAKERKGFTVVEWGGDRSQVR